MINSVKQPTINLSMMIMQISRAFVCWLLVTKSVFFELFMALTLNCSAGKRFDSVEIFNTSK